MSDLANRKETTFEGLKDRECGEHRTTGYRAWCFNCSEWCSPSLPCRGCELPKLRASLVEKEERLQAAERIAKQIGDRRNEDLADRLKVVEATRDWIRGILEEQNVRLDQLAPYVQHKPDCLSNLTSTVTLCPGGQSETQRGPCSCGLAALRISTQGGEPVKDYAVDVSQDRLPGQCPVVHAHPIGMFSGLRCTLPEGHQPTWEHRYVVFSSRSPQRQSTLSTKP